MNTLYYSMNPIEKLINNLTMIEKNIQSIAISELKKESELLSQVNRDQLDVGTTSTGDPMPSYVDSSRGGIRLHDTGDWWAGIKPVFDSDGLDMTSTDYKTSFLDKKYPLALGVRQSIGKILPKIKPKIVVIVKNRIGEALERGLRMSPHTS